MTTIEQLIGDLLLQHNCVIVPSFGGFVAKQSSARIDFNSGKMFPPSKSLLFNKQLINNDGLLVNEYAQAQGVTFDVSSRAVSEKVAEWNATLSSGGRIELDRIGFLFHDAENNLCFEQDRFFNLLLESFGLEQIQFLTEEDVQIVESKINDTISVTPVVPISKEQKETEVIEPIEHPAIQQNKRQVWKYVAAACLLPIAFYSFWIPMKTDVLESGVVSLRDFNPFNKRQEASYKQTPISITDKVNEVEPSLGEKIENLPADVDVYTYKFNDELFIPVNIKPASSNNPNSPTVETYELNQMHYIVGCFSDESNATNLVAKLKSEGLNALIFDVKNGLHRVSAGGAISMEALSQIKTSVEGLGLKGWTLK